MSANASVFTEYLAPAKLNLFLHVTGRRADGYHTLQTAFVLIDRYDYIAIADRSDGQIVLETPLPGVPAEQDLTVKAARLLAAQATRAGRPVPGATLRVRKTIPMGAGLGGGSSDAATVLIALNARWQLGLSRLELMQLGLQLGADVPFFVFGESAFAEGVGEVLQPVALPRYTFAVVFPGIAVPTATIFQAPELTRNEKSIKMLDFASQPLAYSNSLQSVVECRFPAVASGLSWLQCAFPNALAVKMSGSGSSVFAVLEVIPARSARSDLPLQSLAAPEPTSGWVRFTAHSLAHHPHADLLL